jgi:hypothetical protein
MCRNAAAKGLVESLVQCNLQNYAEKRLRAMPIAKLKELYKRFSEKVKLTAISSAPSLRLDLLDDNDDNDDNDDDQGCADSIVSELLRLKQVLKSAAKAPASPPVPPPSSPISSASCSGDDDDDKDDDDKDGDDDKTNASSPEKPPALRVAFFNAYKLRTQNVALQDQWMMLVAVLATFDVVCLTEVPAPPPPPPPQSEAPSDSAKGCCSKSDDGQKRIDAFLVLLRALSPESTQWSYVVSEPSGAVSSSSLSSSSSSAHSNRPEDNNTNEASGSTKAKKPGNQEVHVAFYKTKKETNAALTALSSLEVISHRTLHGVGIHEQVPLDYAPLQLLVRWTWQRHSHKHPQSPTTTTTSAATTTTTATTATTTTESPPSVSTKDDDDSFVVVHSKKLLLTVVHMPPDSRKAQRTTQLKTLLRAYEQDAETRMNTPFTLKGAKDAQTVKASI